MSRPARINVRIDPCISYGFESAPEFYSQRTPLRNGHLAINALWDRMKHMYAGRQIKRPDDYLAVKTLFAVCRGDVSAFRMKDWFDFELTDCEIGTGTGAAQQIQIARVMATGGYDYVDVIEAPAESPIPALELGADVPEPENRIAEVPALPPDPCPPSPEPAPSAQPPAVEVPPALPFPAEVVAPQPPAARVT